MNNKSVFIQLNWTKSVYYGTQRIILAALLSMHGSAYPFNFKNPMRSEMMKRFVPLKLICKRNDNASCLLCLVSNE